VVTEIETDGMLNALGSEGAPATGGTQIPQGFWKHLQAEVTVSADVEKNHFLLNLPDETRLGSQQFDWVVVPSKGDSKLEAPKSSRFQFVPMKSETPFDSSLVSEQLTDDLSDHYAIFAELCYSSECPDVVDGSGNLLPAALEEPRTVDRLTGHDGSCNHLPSVGACTQTETDVIQRGWMYKQKKGGVGWAKYWFEVDQGQTGHPLNKHMGPAMLYWVSSKPKTDKIDPDSIHKRIYLRDIKDMALEDTYSGLRMSGSCFKITHFFRRYRFCIPGGADGKKASQIRDAWLCNLSIAKGTRTEPCPA
jgi:hypothetical protein